jgi:hypothetical protein
MPPPPQKKLRWDRIIIALLLLGGLIGVGVYFIAFK